MNKIERRNVTQEFRVSPEGESPKIAGYAAVFDSPSVDFGWVETIDPHAFDAILATNPDVRAYWNHDDNFVLGRTAPAQERCDSPWMLAALPTRWTPRIHRSVAISSYLCAGRTFESPRLVSFAVAISGRTIRTAQ